MCHRVVSAPCSQLVMIAWALWCNRNEIYHGGEAKTGLEVARYAANYLQEYWSALKKNDSTGSATVQHLGDRHENSQHMAWIPPQSGLCRKNVDGALFPTKKLAGIGVVIRD